MHAHKRLGVRQRDEASVNALLHGEWAVEERERALVHPNPGVLDAQHRLVVLVVRSHPHFARRGEAERIPNQREEHTLELVAVDEHVPRRRVAFDAILDSRRAAEGLRGAGNELAKVDWRERALDAPRVNTAHFRERGEAAG